MATYNHGLIPYGAKAMIEGNYSTENGKTTTWPNTLIQFFSISIGGGVSYGLVHSCTHFFNYFVVCEGDLTHPLKFKSLKSVLGNWLGNNNGNNNLIIN